MARNYLHTLFTDAARALQDQDGSRGHYAMKELGADGACDPLGEREVDFIAARDSFYLASVTADGWPYVQHRGGPPGFLARIAGNQVGFADFRGNRQHISTANLMAEPRVSLLLMDYPNRRRLKLLGQARIFTAAQAPALIARLMPQGYSALPERAYLIDVVGFDWNCAQHITPRFTLTEAGRLLSRNDNHQQEEPS